jgi:hypothetical protein
VELREIWRADVTFRSITTDFTQHRVSVPLSLNARVTSSLLHTEKWSSAETFLSVTCMKCSLPPSDSLHQTVELIESDAYFKV